MKTTSTQHSSFTIYRFFQKCDLFADAPGAVAKGDQLMALVDELEAQLAASRAAGEKLLDALVAELTAGKESHAAA